MNRQPGISAASATTLVGNPAAPMAVDCATAGNSGPIGGFHARTRSTVALSPRGYRKFLGCERLRIHRLAPPVKMGGSLRSRPNGCVAIDSGFPGLMQSGPPRYHWLPFWQLIAVVRFIGSISAFFVSVRDSGSASRGVGASRPSFFFLMQALMLVLGVGRIFRWRRVNSGSIRLPSDHQLDRPPGWSWGRSTITSTHDVHRPVRASSRRIRSRLTEHLRANPLGSGEACSDGFASLWVLIAAATVQPPGWDWRRTSNASSEG